MPTRYLQNAALAVLLVAIGLSLLACAPKEPPPRKVAKLQDGLCKVVQTPTHAVAGQTQFDQDWIDDTTEALVGACKQPRPQPRPEGWTTHSVDGKNVPVPPAETAPPPKKRPWWKRLRKDAG